MNKKSKKVTSLAILNVVLACIILSASANAAQVTYQIGVNENDVFAWEIKELNVNKFEATFGTEPNFKVGSQIRMVIDKVDDIRSEWVITAEFWDYGSNWLAKGSIENFEIPKYPFQYDDLIFIPIPVKSYIEAALVNLSTQYYSFADNMIGKQDVSENGIVFKEEKTFNTDLVIVKLEATFQFIPFGFSFFAFMSLMVIGLIIFIKRKKLISIKT